MRTNSLIIIICVTLILCVVIICGTLIYINQSNNDVKSINVSNNSTASTNNTTASSTTSSSSNSQESDDWFGYVKDQRTGIMPREHAEWESEQIDKAESRGFEVIGCNTGGVKNGYDVYTQDGKFAGHIN
jgi:uncharacterized protein YpmB